MIKVMRNNGVQETFDADSFDIDGGYLILRNKARQVIASVAPGYWQSAEKLQPAPQRNRVDSRKRT